MEIILLLIAHFLGDFIFQGSRMAHGKIDHIKCFLLHSAIYAGTILLPLLCFSPAGSIVLIFCVIVVSHALIDYGRIILQKRMEQKKADHKVKEFTLFITDQLLHILIILVCTRFIVEYSSLGNAIRRNIVKYLDGEQVYLMLVYMLLYIICMAPTAVFIKKVFVLFSIQSDRHTGRKEELINSGYLIGVLERMIILTLGLNAQLGAIGFVIAAKSLARFKQLEDKDFAEKYLFGTLLSVTVSLFCITLGKFLIGTPF